MNDTAQNSFPKAWRLLKRPLFVALSRQGNKVYSRYFIAAVSDNTCPNHRIGITVSRKVGNAVKRNQVKRIIREYIRHRKEQFPRTEHGKFCDINIIVKSQAGYLTNAQITQDLDALFTKFALFLTPGRGQELKS